MGKDHQSLLKTGRSHRIGGRTLGEGKWLYLEEIDYIDRYGCPHTWEAACRQGCQGAVVIIPVLKPSGRYVLIRQYRPPCNAYALEFPAGLIDPGESPETTAARELTEETGYSGQVVAVSPTVISSAGFSRESFHFAHIEIDERRPENADPEQDCEHNEDIEVILALPDEMPDIVQGARSRGDVIDSRVAAYFIGRGIAIW